MSNLQQHIANLSSAYLKRVARNIIPLSKANDVWDAMDEWEWTGRMKDDGENIHDCEYCDHHPIRYRYDIKNKHTGFHLLIGSECIIKYKVAVFDEDGDLMTDEDDIKKALREALKERHKMMLFAVIDTLDYFTGLPGESFKKSYDKNGYLSPSQAKWLIGLYRPDDDRFLPNHPLPPDALTVGLSKNSHKEQIKQMRDDEFKKLKPYLTPQQIKRIEQRGWRS